MNCLKKILLICVALSLFWIGCGLKSKESTFKYRMENLDELINKTEGPIKDELVAKKEGITLAYENLPAQEKEREKLLENINQALYAFLDQADDKIEAAEEAKKKAKRSAFLKELSKFVGVWKAVSMNITITEDGSVEYKRIRQGVTKSFSGGRVIKINPDSLVVKVLLSETTFAVNQAPYQVDGKWKMTLDGVELERIIPQ